MGETLRNSFSFGEFVLDPNQKLLLRNGEIVKLPAKTFELLAYLVENPNRVITKNEIMDAVWQDSLVEDANLSVHISTLRKALGNGNGEHDGENRIAIETFPKVGYRLSANVRAGQGTFDSDTPVKAGSPAEPDAMGSVSGVRRGTKVHSRRIWLVAILFLGMSASLILLAWRSWTNDRPGLSLVPVAGAEGLAAAAFSPDGDHVAIVKRMGGRYVLSTFHLASGSSVPLITADEGQLISNIRFSNNGNHLYYSKRLGSSSVLYKIPLLGGSEVKVAEGIESRISFSPDATQFCYVDTSEPNVMRLIIANEEGSGKRELAKRNSPDYFSAFTLDWSPNGKTIAIAIGSPERNPKIQLAGIDVNTGDETLLSNGKWAGTDGVEWLKDGSGLVAAIFEGSTSPTQLWYMPLAGGEPKKITNDLNNYGLAGLSMDGQSLLAVEFMEETSVWVVSPRTSDEAYPAKADRRHRFQWVRWTSDGGMLFGSDAGESRDVWKIDLDGSEERQLTFGPDANVMPVMTSDGRYIIFAGYRKGDGFFDLFRMNVDGSGQVQLTQGGGAYQPSVSSDGWVYYTAGKMGGPVMLRRVWRVPVNGGVPEQFLDGAAYYPDVSPDGRFVAVWIKGDRDTPAKVAIVSTLSGKIGKVLEGVEGERIDWTPDGKGISFVRTVEGVSNIWTQRLAGGEPTQETRFTAETIRNFEWNADGRLICSRLNNRRRAILMRNFR